MRKIVLLVALCLGIGNAFAQDVDKLRDEGDAALKAKNYTEAVAKYSEYLKLNEYKDTVRIFNCGFSANQAKQYAEAAKFFDMAVKYKYNLDDSYVGEAMAYRNLGKNEEFFATVDAGLKELPKAMPIWRNYYIRRASSWDRLLKRKGISKQLKNFIRRF